MPEDEIVSSYRRFTLADRIEHLVQMVAFVALAVTGLVQTWPANWLSEGIIGLLGGIEALRIIHRVWATILMVGVVYHLGAIGYRKLILRRPRSMIPSRADARAFGQSLRFAIGGRSEPPAQGRFTWQEKVAYWSYVLGIAVMIVTGFLLWNPIATTRLLPGEFIPTAKTFHGNGALLIVLVVVIWHTFDVHIRQWNTSIWSGFMSRADMARHHSLELAAIEAGERPAALQGEARTRITNRYFLVFGGVALALLVGIFFFVTFENTAIETIEPIEDVRVFAPVTTTAPTTTTPPATTTTVPSGAASWETFAASLASTCGGCHGDTGGFGGLSFTSYAGATGAITPGDPDGSLLIATMEAGGHPGQLDDATVAALREWIAAGAPETADGTPPATTTSTTTSTTTTVVEAELSWDTFAGSFVAICGACHGDSGGLGGLSLTSYADAVAGGASGPGIVPGDPDASAIVAKMEAGGHPGQLSDADIEVLREWIAAGAPETIGGSPPTTVADATISWNDFAGILASTCGGCHGDSGGMGGVSLTSYAGAGAVIVPGDPGGSPLVATVEAGGHPGQLDEATLDALREWIAAGAPGS
jgi:cytochrome b subunit of formate dehydrogenase/mono/diheme cytochrome c family protein